MIDLPFQRIPLLLIGSVMACNVMAAAGTASPTPAERKHNEYTCALGPPYKCNREWLTAGDGKKSNQIAAPTPEQRKHNLYTCTLGPPYVCNRQWLTAEDRKKIEQAQRKTKKMDLF